MEQHQATARASQRVMVLWADLPSDIITLIASKCSSNAADYVGLCRICRHWCHSLTEASPIPPLPTPQLPFLLVPPRPICPLFDAMPRLGKVFPVPFRKRCTGDAPQLVDDLPQLKNMQGMICVGSSHGWLITLDRGSNVSLLNPVTADELRLRPLSSIDNSILSFNGDSSPEYRLTEKGISHSQFSIVHRAVLSSDPAQDMKFTLLLFLSDLTDHCFTLCGRSGVCRHHKHTPILVEDVIFISGVFIAIGRNINLVYFDFRNKESRLVTSSDIIIVTAPFRNIFLVNSGGRLWIVFTSILIRQYQHIIPKKYIKVYEYPLNCNPDVGPKKITEFRDLALFLGHGCSVCVPVRHLTCPAETAHFAHIYTVLGGVKEGEGPPRVTVMYHGAVYQKDIGTKPRLEPVRVFDVECSVNADLWATPRPFWVSPNINRIYR